MPSREAGTQIQVWVRYETFNALKERAFQEGLTVSKLVGNLLYAHLGDEIEDPWVEFVRRRTRECLESTAIVPQGEYTASTLWRIFNEFPERDPTHSEVVTLGKKLKHAGWERGRRIGGIIYWRIGDMPGVVVDPDYWRDRVAMEVLHALSDTLTDLEMYKAHKGSLTPELDITLFDRQMIRHYMHRYGWYDNDNDGVYHAPDLESGTGIDDRTPEQRYRDEQLLAARGTGPRSGGVGPSGGGSK